EQYAPKRALALYQALDATLAAPLAIEAVSAQTLATLVQDETVWTGLADQIDALDDDASALEQAIGALTSTLGPSGQLAGAISEVDDFQRSHPLSRYRERWQSLAALDQQRQRIAEHLAQADQLLAEQRTRRQTLTVEEARQFVHQLESDEQTLRDART